MLLVSSQSFGFEFPCVPSRVRRLKSTFRPAFFVSARRQPGRRPPAFVFVAHLLFVLCLWHVHAREKKGRKYLVKMDSCKFSGENHTCSPSSNTLGGERTMQD